ncbi:hypothetical protein CERSUDRAFT_142422 [Gelatoporia subvermispora B]|uniref:Cupin type-1 domain-containing protein n=1 Tax=Ceriporiopsis subvermispora (strain B) TaxID=914234 RepID=M2R3I0_CERS8|nr:hypothetical protein CERSUDRAFT_142422 [Gelatoporia subvermispora B]
MPLTPISSLRVSLHLIPAHGRIPNTSIHNRPLIIYHNAFVDSSLTADRIEAHLTRVGVVRPNWRYTMYPTSHFHSTTHELLVIVHGRGRMLFGGDENPNAVETEIRKGDAILIPAGVAHKLVEDQEGGFQMVGSYPVGAQEWDMCYGKGGKEEEGVEERIRQLGWFQKDPLYGDKGPALSD